MTDQMQTAINPTIVPAVTQETTQEILQEAVTDVLNTLENPTNPSNLLADIEIAIKLVKRFQNITSSLHPEAIALIKRLI